MRTPSKSPTVRACQYVDPDTGKHCEAELTGRGPRKWCELDYRQFVRPAQNRESKRRQRVKKDERQTALESWHIFVHRRRWGGKMTAAKFFELFSSYFPFSLPSHFTLSLQIKLVVYPHVVDFLAVAPDGYLVFALTIFGPNSVGYCLGASYALLLCRREVVSLATGYYTRWGARPRRPIRIIVGFFDMHSCLPAQCFHLVPSGRPLPSGPALLGIPTAVLEDTPEEIKEDSRMLAGFFDFSLPFQTVEYEAKNQHVDPAKRLQIRKLYLLTKGSQPKLLKFL